MKLNFAMVSELEIMRQRLEKIRYEAYSNPPYTYSRALALYSEEIENMKSRFEDILTHTDQK